MESEKCFTTPLENEKEHFRESGGNMEARNFMNNYVGAITENVQVQEIVPVRENVNCEQSADRAHSDNEQTNESSKLSIEIETLPSNTDNSIYKSKPSFCDEVSSKGEQHPINVPENNNKELQKGLKMTKSDGEDCLRDSAEVTENIVLVPPDGGWGWVVALGAFIIMTLMPTVGPCFGILFSGFLTEQGSSSTTTSWIFNIQMFIWHLTATLVNPLTQEFGWRKVGAVGILLTSFAIMLSAFSPSAGFLFFSFSFISGVGNGLGITMCFIIVPQYFEKRRGLSNSLLMTGICVGQILGAPLARHLLEEYGFIGASLIFGALILNGLIGISFFHPVQWHLKKTRKIKRVSEQGNHSPLLEANANGTAYSTLGKHEIALTEKERTLSVLNGTSNKMKINRKEGNSVKDEYSKGCFTLLFDIIIRVIKLIKSDLKITRMYRAVIIASGTTLCVIGYLNFLMLVPFAMQAADYSLQDASWCISVFGMSNMLIRFVISPLTDWKKFNMRFCMMAGYALAGISMFVFPFLKEMAWMMAAMIPFGCGIGANMALNTLVMIKYMGIENMASTLGFASLLVALGCVTLGPFVGFIRDVSNSYAISMWILSGFLGGSFFLWLFMPTAVRLDTEYINKKKKKGLIIVTCPGLASVQFV